MRREDTNISSIGLPISFGGGGIKYLIIKELNTNIYPQYLAADRFVIHIGDCLPISRAYKSLKFLLTNHMYTRKEISGAYPLKNRLAYVSPEVETMDIQIQDIIAVSADNVDVDNPWGGNEVEW